MLTSLLTALWPSDFPAFSPCPQGSCPTATALADRVGIGAGSGSACRALCRWGGWLGSIWVSPCVRAAAGRWAQERLSPETHAGVVSVSIRDLPGWPWEPYSIYLSYVHEGLEQWTHDPLVLLSPFGPSGSGPAESPAPWPVAERPMKAGVSGTVLLRVYQSLARIPRRPPRHRLAWQGRLCPLAALWRSAQLAFRLSGLPVRVPVASSALMRVSMRAVMSGPRRVQP
jgi:hypothetical protein